MMKKSRYKDIIMLGAVAFSAIIFVAAAAFGLSTLSDKSRHMVDLKLQSRTADNQLSSLAAAKKQLQKYSFFNSVAQTVIPNDKDQAQAVLDIFQMASASGIALQNITFPASNLGVTASTTPGSASSASTSTSGGSSALSQAKAVPGIPGLYSLQLIITPQTDTQQTANPSATYPKFLDFLNRIEHDRRTAQITQVSVEPVSGGYGINFSLTVNIFIKP